MAREVKGRRPYRSPLRAEQARATRRRIVDAARTLFLQRGYPATTVEAVAAHAGVAADTVYHVFGSKRGLLKEVMDVTIAGDDEPLAVLDRPGPQQVRAEPDQHAQVRMTVHAVAVQLESIRPMSDILYSAATVDDDAAALREDIELRQRRAAMRTIVGWVAANGPLRDDQAVDVAGDALWVLTSPELHRLFRDACGWTSEQYAQWLERAALDALLPVGRARPRRR